jgi:UDP-GlcNAc:undecaprenyl-phosphate GlcNAc-1-phosphate transferase
MLPISKFILPLLLSFLLAYFLTPFIRRLAVGFGVVDQPKKRKVHKKPIPRLGGVAIYLAFLLMALLSLAIWPDLFDFGPYNDLDPLLPFIGMIAGGIVLVIGGVLDDIYDLSPGKKILFQALAAVVAISFGIGIDFIRSPFGGYIRLDDLVYNYHLLGRSFQFVVWADLLAFIWIIAIINVVNWLDGLDGLAAGVSSIASLFIFVLSILAGVQQPLTALIAIILAGSILGFLPFNFNPASIFMGDSGSQFLGYMLGILAIICGGKLATAGLVLGFPILDGLWVIVRRLITGRSPFVADKKHLHHRLLAIGFSQKQVVFILYGLSVAFGLIAIWASSYRKFWAGIILVLIMVIGAFYLIRVESKIFKKEN